MGTALAARCTPPPNEGPENRSQSRPARFGKSKGRDQRRSKRRDRKGPARSYAVVGFSALLGGPGLAGGLSPLPVGRTASAHRKPAPGRMLLPPDQFWATSAWNSCSD